MTTSKPDKLNEGAAHRVLAYAPPPAFKLFPGVSVIELNDITIAYERVTVIKDLSLTINKGEFFTLLGSSGCGKTTLLRAISGFVRPKSGTVTVDSKELTNLGPEDRNVGIVFQNYALFPTMSVFENVAFGLRVANVSKTEIKDRVEASLEKIGVAEHAHKKPSELSGGQQQRVAIARALIMGSDVLLFDEPLSNLDAKMRETMRDEIRSIQQSLGLTAVYVTHDQQEALAISDRIAVLEKGNIEQIGTPSEIYHEPATEFVFRFIGESSHLDSGILTKSNGSQVAKDAVNNSVYARPEDFVIGDKSGKGWITFDTTLNRSEFRGNANRLILDCGDGQLQCDVDSRFAEISPGQSLKVSIKEEHICSFPKGGR